MTTSRSSISKTSSSRAKSSNASATDQTREVKCVIRGFTLDDLEAETIVKIGPTGKLFVITVYLA